MVIAHPSATVIPLREAGDSYEILLIHRNPKLSFHGGAWAFPGGRIDPDDYVSNDDVIEAARRAAVREAREEAGIHVLPEDMVLISQWTTPESQPKRFKTWFFIAQIPDQNVRVDGGETLDYRWMSPTQALNAQRTGELVLMPPTFVSITRLSHHSTIDAALSMMITNPLEEFLPRIRLIDGGFLSLYNSDAAYEGGDLNQPGRRHRLWALDSSWKYEHKD
jgi:8-oxo-dGTP pyrophosphatase MutT (NUDIX family)